MAIDTDGLICFALRFGLQRQLHWAAAAACKHATCKVHGSVAANDTGRLQVRPRWSWGSTVVKKPLLLVPPQATARAEAVRRIGLRSGAGVTECQDRVSPGSMAAS